MKLSLETRLLIAVAALAMLAAASAAQPTIDQIFGLARVGGLSLSPDGSQVAYTVKGEIRIVGSDGSDDRPTAAGSAPKWSPSGREIAFLSDAGGSGQIWTVDSTGGNSIAVVFLP